MVVGQETLLLDHGFRTIGSTGAVDEALKEAATDAYRKGKRSFNLSFEGHNYYSLMQYNALTGWITMTIADEKELFAGGADLRDYIITICLLVILIAMVLVLLIVIVGTATAEETSHMHTVLRSAIHAPPLPYLQS